MITNINKIEIKNCIVDELHVRERTDQNINLSPSRDDWQIDTYALAKFAGNLEAGNIENNGLEVVKFAIKRREVNELNSITLEYVNYEEGKPIDVVDYTQGNREYIYSVVPIVENGLEGTPNEVRIQSDFVGWWLVDRDTKNLLGFDMSIGSVENVELQLNQGRTVVETLNKYPHVYRDPRQYHTFSLSTVIIPSEFERSGASYDQILNNFINNHKPFLVKSDTGLLFVCDVSTPRHSSPKNTWRGHDYIELTLDFIEVQDYNEYILEREV